MPLHCSFCSAGRDYTALLAVVEFSPTDTVQQINVSIQEDDALENEEFFSVQLTPSEGTVVDAASGLATVNISDSTTGMNCLLACE